MHLCGIRKYELCLTLAHLCLTLFLICQRARKRNVKNGLQGPLLAVHEGGQEEEIEDP